MEKSVKKLSTTVDKLTRQMVYNIELGETITFRLPSFQATNNARNTVSIAAGITGNKYSVSVSRVDNTVTVSRYD